MVCKKRRKPLVLRGARQVGKSTLVRRFALQNKLQKNTDIAIRFDLNMPSLQNVRHTAATRNGNKAVAFRLLSLPLYMVEELPRIIDWLRNAPSSS